MAGTTLIGRTISPAEFRGHPAPRLPPHSPPRLPHTSASSMGIYSDSRILCAGLGSVLFGIFLSSVNTVWGWVVLANEWCGNSYTASCDLENTYYKTITLFLALAGAAIGCNIAGSVVSSGRTSALKLSHLVFIAGSVAMAVWSSFAVFAIAKFIQGVAVGIVAVTVPMYIAEMAPKHVRGQRGVLHQLFITIGIMVGNLSVTPIGKVPSDLDENYAMDDAQRTTIKLILASPAFISTIALIAFTLFVPQDTPAFLFTSQKPSECKKVLRGIYGEETYEQEWKELVAQQEQAPSKQGLSLFEIMGDPWYRYPLFIGVALAVGQQLSGINVFVTISSKIFEDAGVTDPDFASVSMSLVNVVMTLLAIPVIDTFGRTPLLVWGGVGQFLFLGAVPLANVVPSLVPFQATITCVSVIGFVVCFAIGWGPVVWVYISEMFPPESRDQSCGFASSMNWVGGIFMVTAAQILTAEYWLVPKFVFFSIASLFCAFFVQAFVIETKGRNLAVSPYLAGKEDVETQPFIE